MDVHYSKQDIKTSLVKNYHNVQLYDNSLCNFISFIFAITSIIFIITAYSLPFLVINVSGLTNSVFIFDCISVLSNNSYYLSVFIYIVTLIFPLFVVLLIFFSYLSVLLNKKFSFVLKTLKFYHFLVNWSMLDVYMMGVLVALIKITSLTEVLYEYGFWCFLLSSIFFTLSIQTFNIKKIWNFYKPSDNTQKHLNLNNNEINQDFKECDHCGLTIPLSENKCPRCYTTLFIKSSKQKTIAILLAAIFFYLPANIYPIMITSYLGASTPSNILDGVVTLWNMDSYFVALVIFIASICIPVLKMILICYLCFVSKKITQKKQSKRHINIYKFVEFIGKWSMIDIFVVGIMSAIVQVENIMTISPGEAVIPFTIVVILTMISAQFFEPKLLLVQKKDKDKANVI